MNERFLFGRFVEDGPLDACAAEELAAHARREVDRAAATPLDRILDVLEAAGRLWSDREAPFVREARERLGKLIPFSPPMIDHTLALLPHLLTRDAMLDRIRAELGDPDQLDGWTLDGAFGGSTSLRPRGALLHVSAGNVFLGCVDSLVMGLITKNVNVLKLSRNDPYFPVAFARSLVACDPHGHVIRSLAIVSWKGGDESVETVFKQNMDTIMVWGGEDAVRNWRTGLGLSTKLVEYGPKLSGALLTRRGLAAPELPRIAKGLARDAAMWDQAACSSPQTVYVQDIDEPGSGVKALIPHLLAALEEAEVALPRGRMTLDEKVEVRKSREMARFAAAQGEAQIWESPGDLRYTVIHERRPGFVLSPLNRTLVLRSITDPAEALKELEPVRPYLQCMAVAAAQDELPGLAMRLVDAGVHRVCAPGDTSLVKPGTPHDGRFPLGELVRRAALEAPVPAFSIQRRLARVLVHSARRSPFYARRLKDVELEANDALESLPLLSKDDIYKHTPPVGNDLLTGTTDGAVVFASGGSTGQPKYSYYTNAEFDRVTAVLARLLSSAGLAKGDRVGNLFIAGQLWSSFVAVHQALEKLDCLNLPIGGHSEMEVMIDYLKTFKANVLIGLPSMIMELAHHVKARKVHLEIEKVFYGGEHVSDEMRAFLAKTLGVKIVRSAGYASVDAGTIGYQCSAAVGSIHHLMEGHQYLELLHPETGQPVAGSEPGEIVVTSLERMLMPLIRYRTGDLARRVTGACGCGSRDARFELLGRCDDRLQIGGARVVLPDISRALATVPGMSPLFQLEASAQGSREKLVLRVEMDREPGRGKRALEKAVREAVLAASEDLRLSVSRGWLKTLGIELLPPGGLPRLPRTRKVRTVIDRRGATRRTVKR
jgi:phenylacetate-CoA ligase